MMLHLELEANSEAASSSDVQSAAGSAKNLPESATETAKKSTLGSGKWQPMKKTRDPRVLRRLMQSKQKKEQEQAAAVWVSADMHSASSLKLHKSLQSKNALCTAALCT